MKSLDSFLFLCQFKIMDMTRHISFVLGVMITAVLSFVLSACSGEKAEEAVWGDYVVACGDSDLYIVDASKSTDDSLAVLWHWNVFESYGQIPDVYRHKIREIGRAHV